MQPLYDCIPRVATVPFQMTAEAIEAFKSLKQAIITAPALGIPNYNLPFRLYVMERQGHATGVLTQSHGGRNRPLGYFSKRLDPVARATPSCVRAVHAASSLLNAIADIILGHPLTIMAPHDISAILQQTQPKHLTAQRHLRLQCSLLLPDNVTIQRCHILNPAALLPLPRGEYTADRDSTDYLDDQIWEIMKLLNTSNIVQNQLIIVTNQHTLVLDYLTSKDGGMCQIVGTACCHYINPQGNLQVKAGLEKMSEIRDKWLEAHRADKSTWWSDTFSFLNPSNWFKGIGGWLMGIFQGILQIALILLISYILIKFVVSCINRITRKKKTAKEPILLLYEQIASTVVDKDVIPSFPTPPPSPSPADVPPPPKTEDSRHEN
ncbi:uncharacterized protein LOC121002335 [Bufo bufo]|uniref:uncharacterized protein LOC121002335 n=1 Tax=Bufo bufo TaxID=8384 RepID=UPI001ABDCD7C|nr:uncharacterized protein LOC121002335 [Bufo bufo]